MKRRHLGRRLFVQGLTGSVVTRVLFGEDSPRNNLKLAASLLQKSVDRGVLSAASLYAQVGDLVVRRGFGAADPDSVFLVASITKPLTACGVMVLADRGLLKISDPVSRFIPEFSEGDRKLVTIRHLLTHTSGLPDQLPENVELRRRQAPLEEFVERAIRTPLLFRPGTEVRYQSMGFLLASEICQRILSFPFSEYLRNEVFEPLDMRQTALGLGDIELSETVQCQVDEAPDYYGGGDDKASWNWNSPYWRNLGVPWGGAHSTGPDLENFLHSFIEPRIGPLKTTTAESMITNQNQGMSTPWGLGFMVQTDAFGARCPSGAFGHTGSTGTLCWADRETNTSCILLTTLPAVVSRKTLLEPVSDLVGEATSYR